MGDGATPLIAAGLAKPAPVALLATRALVQGPSVQISFPSDKWRPMKFSHVAVIYGDEESEEYAVLAEDGQQAREVLAAFDRLSGNPLPKCRDQGNRKGIM